MLRQWSSRASLVAAVTLVVGSTASCVFGPTGTNSATGIYPSPVSGKITLPYTASTDDGSVTVVHFALEGQDSVSIPDDDSPDDGFNAVVPISGLPAGIYTVDATEGDATDVTSHLTLVVTGADGGASGAADTGGSGAASTGGASGAADTGASGT